MAAHRKSDTKPRLSVRGRTRKMIARACFRRVRRITPENRAARARQPGKNAPLICRRPGWLDKPFISMTHQGDENSSVGCTQSIGIALQRFVGQMMRRGPVSRVPPITWISGPVMIFAANEAITFLIQGIPLPELIEPLQRLQFFFIGQFDRRNERHGQSILFLPIVAQSGERLISVSVKTLANSFAQQNFRPHLWEYGGGSYPTSQRGTSTLG
jgi:hypothetical protein